MSVEIMEYRNKENKINAIQTKQISSPVCLFVFRYQMESTEQKNEKRKEKKIYK
jgi:hypothetical protein